MNLTLTNSRHDIRLHMTASDLNVIRENEGGGNNVQLEIIIGGTQSIRLKGIQVAILANFLARNIL